MSRRHHTHRLKKPRQSNVLTDLWESFWTPPDEKCPKCEGIFIEYYDPFFFSPIRTLKGRRRVKCQTCRFIWRPKRKSTNTWDKLFFRR